MTRRIVALSIIFACSWTAWAILTLVVHLRTDEKSESMSDAVGQIWGAEHVQTAPTVVATWTTQTKREVKRSYGGEWEYVKNEAPAPEPEADAEEGDGAPAGVVPDPMAKDDQAYVTIEVLSTEFVTEKVAVKEEGDKKKLKSKSKYKPRLQEKKYEVIVYRHTAELTLARSDIDVNLDVAHRKKGLLWFATYGVEFDSSYSVVNPFPHPVMMTVTFSYPSSNAVYDNMMVKVPGRDDVETNTENGQMSGAFQVAAYGEQRFDFAYRSRGMDRWNYRFGNNVKLVENFKLHMNTNFDEIDFPMGSISPDTKERLGKGAGWGLHWEKESLVSGLEIGMLMPHKINPGPLAASMSIHAPVSLFFFFFVMFILQVLRNLKIHPMNYFFIAASFFAFNLLFSYLVNHLDVYVSFGISSAVSVFLVTSYLRIVVGTRFALVEAGLCQIVYQVLFSVAHFLEGYTGLTVTIGAILTLAIAMRLTARTDWTSVFAGKPAMKVSTASPEI